MLQLLSTELHNLIRETDVYKATPHLVIMNYILLIPWSCRVEDSLEYNGHDTGIVIKQEKSLQFEVDIMGKKRVFRPTMYSITKGDKV